MNEGKRRRRARRKAKTRGAKKAIDLKSIPVHTPDRGLLSLDLTGENLAVLPEVLLLKVAGVEMLYVDRGDGNFRAARGALRLDLDETDEPGDDGQLDLPFDGLSQVLEEPAELEAQAPTG